MRFKKSLQLPGAGRTMAWHHHGSHTPTSPGAILLGKMAYHTKQIYPAPYPTRRLLYRIYLTNKEKETIPNWMQSVDKKTTGMLINSYLCNI